MESNRTKPVSTLKAHLALNVKNVARSIEFYRRMLGLEPSKVRNGYAKFDVQHPPLNLTLNEVPFNERGALSHLGIQVASTDDVLRQRELWAAAGLVTRDEMQTDCCYATQDKTWVSDPDGNEWEVFVVLQDNLPEVEQVGAAACCAPSAPAQPTVQISAACACESAPPPVGQAPCCDTQAAKFASTR